MAGTYITGADLEQALPADWVARTDETQRDQHAQRANADLDQALRQAGYTLPITTTPIPDDIKGRLLDLATYRLALQQQLLPEPAESSGFYLAYKTALAWLEGVRSGRVELGLDDSSGGTPDTEGGIEAATLPRRYWELF